MTKADLALFPSTGRATTATRSTVTWTLEDWASITPAGDDSLTVRYRQDYWILRWVIKSLDSETYQVLKTLGERRSVASTTGALKLPRSGVAERLSLEINRLLSGRVLRISVGSSGSEAQLLVRPASRTARIVLPLEAPRKPVRLSQHVTVRRVADALEIDSPIYGFVLESRGSCLGSLLATTAQRARAPEELLDGLEPDLRREQAVCLLAMLAATGVLGEVDDAGLLAEERDPILMQRQPADVTFHHASRLGLHSGPTGATFRFAGLIPPTPAVRTGAFDAEKMVKLEHDDPGGVAARTSFTEAVSRRKSTRNHGTEPLTARQLGEFLYRVARVDRIVPVDESDPNSYECSERPYPSGGGGYELELYLVIGRCAGIEKGLYRYRPVEHGLQPMAASGSQCAFLLEHARLMSGAKEPPQVHILLGARFTRLSWKYENMAYATTLKNVGVLYESMYLTAAAMGLAGCALGNGDSGLFAEVTGLRVEEESSVGEFTLGSLPDRESKGAAQG